MNLVAWIIPVWPLSMIVAVRLYRSLRGDPMTMGALLAFVAGPVSTIVLAGMRLAVRCGVQRTYYVRVQIPADSLQGVVTKAIPIRSAKSPAGIRADLALLTEDEATIMIAEAQMA